MIYTQFMFQKFLVDRSVSHCVPFAWWRGGGHVGDKV
jgi:hypothetical protein